MYSENYKLIVRKGLFASIYVPVNVFFNIFDVFSNITHFTITLPYLYDRAMLWLSSNGLDPVSDNLVFVHIRRGDYLSWPSVKFSCCTCSILVLKRNEEHMKQSFPDAIFVLMGDDVMYLEDIAPYCLIVLSHIILHIPICAYDFMSSWYFVCKFFCLVGFYICKQRLSISITLFCPKILDRIPY